MTVKHTMNAKLLLLAVMLAFASALTNEELSLFKTNGNKERNTGIAGWVKVTTSGSYHYFSSNGIPDHDTGRFPIKFNPNSIKEQSNRFTIPASPRMDPNGPKCLNQGPIGITINGVPFFNPMNANGENAGEVEVFDLCSGHPDRRGRYHYHILPTCLFKDTVNQFVGVAIDGYPVYGPLTDGGKVLTGSDLDECNGRTVNGKYRYHLTHEFPYIMGCYKGVVVKRPTPGEQCYFAYNTAKPLTNGATTPAPNPGPNTSGTKTSGGNAKGAFCVFPFNYRGVKFSSCIMQGHTQPWCGTTSDYTSDKKWGNCLASDGTPAKCSCATRCCNGSIREKATFFSENNKPNTSSTKCCGCTLCRRPMPGRM